MKSILLFVAIAYAQDAPPAELPIKAVKPAEPEAATPQEKLSFFEFDNAKMLYNNDFGAYRDMRESQALGLPDNNCKLAESDNFYGA